MNKIYTKTGDNGRTLIKDRRVAKDDPLLEAMGALDELSCFLGLARAEAGTKREKNLLLKVQKHILVLNAVLAGYEDDFPVGPVKFLEGKMDFWQKNLPRQKSFVLPGKTRFEACLHICRAICRRSERQVIKLNVSSLAIKQYLNRLGDFLFVMARKN